MHNQQLLSNVTKYAPKHYVHIGLVADWKHGEPQVLEPEKCESWNWCDLNTLPKPLFHLIKWHVVAQQTTENAGGVSSSEI